MYAHTNNSISHAAYHTVLVGSSKTPKKLLLLGTSSGHICGYHEVHSGIDSVPIFFWMSENSNNGGIYSAKEPTDKEISVRPASKPLTANSACFPHHSYSYFGTVFMILRCIIPLSVIVIFIFHQIDEHDNNPAKPPPLLNMSPSNSTSAVIWTYKISGSHSLLAGYANGTVIAWDLATQNKLYTLCDSSMQLGPELNGMRRHDSNIPDTNTPVYATAKQRHPGDLAPYSRFHHHPPQTTNATVGTAAAVVAQTAEAIDDVLRTAQSTIESNRLKLTNKQNSRDRSDFVEVNTVECNSAQPVYDEVKDANAGNEALKTSQSRLRRKHEKKKGKSRFQIMHLISLQSFKLQAA